MGISKFRSTRRLVCLLAVAALVVSPRLAAFADNDGQPLKPMAPVIDPNADRGHRGPRKPLQASISHNEQVGKRNQPRPPMRATVTTGGYPGAGREAQMAPTEALNGKANDGGFAIQSTSGYGVIGVKFVLMAGRPPIVNRVFAGTPAAKVGMQTQDAIVAVDGVPTMGLTKEEVYDLIIGSPGTNVSLSLMRGGNVMVVTCTRMDINDILDPGVRRDYMLNM